MCAVSWRRPESILIFGIEEYLRNKTYPSAIPARDYGSKSNFRRATKCYKVKDGHLFCKKRLVVKDKESQMEIIRDGRRGTGDSEHSMVSHRGKNTTYDNIAQRFFWHNIAADINKYVKLRVSNSAKNKVT